MPVSSIAVVGSRTVDCTQDIERILAKVLEQNGPFKLVSGGADGVDSIAADWARRNRLEVIVHEADWENGGPQAGMKRNGLIVNDAEILLAFWDGVSGGTLDSIKKARSQNKGVRVYLC